MALLIAHRLLVGPLAALVVAPEGEFVQNLRTAVKDHRIAGIDLGVAAGNPHVDAVGTVYAQDRYPLVR
jgi:hypothetical protein